MLDSYQMDLPLESWSASVSSLLGSPGPGAPSAGCTQREPFAASSYDCVYLSVCFAFDIHLLLLHTFRAKIFAQNLSS